MRPGIKIKKDTMALLGIWGQWPKVKYLRLSACFMSASNDWTVMDEQSWILRLLNMGHLVEM